MRQQLPAHGPPTKRMPCCSVAVLGLGNVAVDCARVLLQPVDRLACTDIASHALEQLRHSAVQEVHLVGRRGPVQVIAQRPLGWLAQLHCSSTCPSSPAECVPVKPLLS